VWLIVTSFRQFQAVLYQPKMAERLLKLKLAGVSPVTVAVTL
jgi:hypothetical protein